MNNLGGMDSQVFSETRKTTQQPGGFIASYSHGSGHDLHHPFHHGDHRQVVHQHHGEDPDFEASKLTDRQHHCQHQKHFKR
jgi:hypothetical protein